MAARLLRTLLGVSTATATSNWTRVEPLRFEGLVTAVFTPYAADGSLDLTAVEGQAEHLARTSVKGVFVGGTTGDSLSLSLEERKQLFEAWAPVAKKHGLVLIAHVGAEALAEAVELTKHAAAHGAQAIGCMPPVFFKPSNTEAGALWLQKVGAAAPNLPLYWYHIPSMTGVLLNMIDLVKAVEKVGVPSFAGIKYTGLYETRALMDAQLVKEYEGGRYDVYGGREEMTVELLSIGIKGFIGSQFNFAGDVYAAIAAAYNGNNVTKAVRIQRLALDLMNAWLEDKPTGVNANRMVMDFANVKVGPARLPSLSGSNDYALGLFNRLAAWCVSAKEVLGWTPLMCAKQSAPEIHL